MNDHGRETGPHWLFFSEPILARQARALGLMVLTKTMESRPEIGLGSYDRMFPNQDWMPAGGFGNLIALPLQKAARANGNSTFIDEQDRSHPDQWDFLEAVRRVSRDQVMDRVGKRENGNVLGMDEVSLEEDKEDQWSRVPSPDLFSARTAKSETATFTEIPMRLDGEVSVPLEVIGHIFPSALRNRLIRLAAFPNPQFYEAQRLRLNTFQIPRVISCAVQSEGWLRLPRGLEAQVRDCLHDFGIEPQIDDCRNGGRSIEVEFTGALLPAQQTALNEVMAHNTGVLCAPTGFGKTVLACALLASRKVNTLILVLPISWRGTLQQYVGRLARNLSQKASIRVYDYQDLGHPILLKMAEKRRTGYKVLGFKDVAKQPYSGAILSHQ